VEQLVEPIAEPNSRTLNLPATQATSIPRNGNPEASPSNVISTSPGEIRLIRVGGGINSSSANPALLFALIGVLVILAPLSLWMMLGKGAPIRKRVAGGVLAGLSLFSAKELSGTLLKELKIDALLKVENPSFSFHSLLAQIRNLS